MKLDVPSDFLAPSCLDYSAYCRTAVRGGFAADDMLSQALACAQEALHWKKGGNFEEVTPKTLIRDDPEDVWQVSAVKASLKYAIHTLSFLVCKFADGSAFVACGYDKHGLLVCHPTDKTYGNWGKKYIPWAEVSTNMKGCFGVF